MNKRKIASSEIKAKNRQMIYEFIRENQSVSKQDIVFGLQLSLPTITQNLQYLEKHGLIDSSDKITHTGGRNATAYAYIKDAKAALGVYLTANHINVVAVDLFGNIMGMIRERIRFDLDDDHYLRRVGSAVEAVKEKAEISDEALLGVGITVPGLVSEDGESVSYGFTLNFSGRTRAEIAKYIPYKTRMFHDSFVAGYAEVWIDQEIQNAFYISLNNSVGGAIVIDREIYSGNADKGGEIGHMTTQPRDGKQCYCGKYGCYDTVGHAGNLDSYTDGNLGEFFNLLKDGDKKAKELWDEYLDNLALAINNIRVLFDSDIILGGYVGAYIDEHKEELYRRVDERNPFDDKARDYVVPCKYKVEATAAGAAILFIDEFLENI